MPLIAHHPGQLLRRTDDTSIYMTLRMLWHAVRELVVYSEVILLWDDEGHSSTLTSALDLQPTLSELFNDPLLRARIRQKVQERPRCICAFKIGKSIVKAAEDALTYTFQISYEAANDGLKMWRLPTLIVTWFSEMSRSTLNADALHFIKLNSTFKISVFISGRNIFYTWLSNMNSNNSVNFNVTWDYWTLPRIQRLVLRFELK